MQFFHRYKNKCEDKLKFVQKENGEDEAYFIITIGFRKSNNAIEKQNKYDV